MKLLAHTGFEFGKVWAGGTQVINSLSVLKSYVKAATKNNIEIQGSGNARLLKQADDASVGTRAPDEVGSGKQGGILQLQSARDTHLHLISTVAAGFEIAQVHWASTVPNISTANADQDFNLKFESGGSAYTLIWDANGLRLFDVSAGSFLTATNDNTSTGVVKTDFAKFYHAQVWVDANDDLNVRAVAKDAPTEIIHWNITGTFAAPSGIEISGPESSGPVLDDLTLYEIEDSTDFPAQDATTNDFQPALREVSVIAKSGSDQNVRFYFPDATVPGDWKASTNGVESDLSDGADTTFAEAGTNRAGWEQWINSGADAINTIPLLDSEGNSVAWGAIHNTKLHHWQVADDDGEDFTAGAEASSAIKQDGTAHLLQTPQTKHLQGVIGQSGMLTANWDFSGLTGSDGEPIDETALTDLKMSIKKA